MKEEKRESKIIFEEFPGDRKNKDIKEVTVDIKEEKKSSNNNNYKYIFILLITLLLFLASSFFNKYIIDNAEQNKGYFNYNIK